MIYLYKLIQGDKVMFLAFLFLFLIMFFSLDKFIKHVGLEKKAAQEGKTLTKLGFILEITLPALILLYSASIMVFPFRSEIRHYLLYFSQYETFYAIGLLFLYVVVASSVYVFLLTVLPRIKWIKERLFE